jgi:SAM-dependent methyltransferase
VLAAWLAGLPLSDNRAVLDLACGTGVSAQVLQRAGWDVIGIDLSPAMLARAASRLAGEVDAGRVVLRQADMTAVELAEQVRACVALEGALNHLLSEDMLARCFERVGTALEPGGVFVFDLYESHHFRGWHHVSVTDEPDAVVVKRGVWDEARTVGMLRISGFFDDGEGPARVDQTMTSRVYRADTVTALLSGAGLAASVFSAPVPDCACGRSRTGNCRTVYLATKAGASRP